MWVLEFGLYLDFGLWDLEFNKLGCRRHVLFACLRLAVSFLQTRFCLECGLWFLFGIWILDFGISASVISPARVRSPLLRLIPLKSAEARPTLRTGRLPPCRAPLFNTVIGWPLVLTCFSLLPLQDGLALALRRLDEYCQGYSRLLPLH